MSDAETLPPAVPVRPSGGVTYPRVVTLAAAAIVIAALHFAEDVFVPIALAILFSFLLAPAVARLERWHLGRVASVVIAVLAVAMVIGATGWLVAGQVTNLASRLPDYKQTLQRRVDDLRENTGESLSKAAAAVKELGENIDGSTPTPARPQIQRVEVVDRPVSAVESISNAVGRLLNVLGFIGIVTVLVIFMLLQREGLRDRFIWLAGNERLPVTTQMLEEASKKVSDYLFAQLIINGAQGIMVGIGLAVIGVPDPLVWGLLSALLRFIPYVGPWIAAVCPILVSLAIFDGWTKPLVTIGFFVTLELVSNNVIEPWMYGARTGVSPLAILIAALFWTWLWGGLGLVLATPLTVCLTVMGKYLPQMHFLTVLLGDKPALSPPARLYQRLLAGDHDGAWEAIAEPLTKQSLLEVYDSLMMPALALAAQDRRVGELERTQREFIERSLAELVEEAADYKNSSAESPPSQDGQAPAEPRDAPLRVLCLPASDEADRTAALMLCEVLRQDGLESEAVSAVYLAAEMMDIVERFDPDVVCVSHVPPPGLGPVRYLCKRMVDRFPEVPIIVGAWSHELDEQTAKLRLPRGGDFYMAVTLAEARSRVLQVLEHSRLKPGRKAKSQRAAAASRLLQATSRAAEATADGADAREA